MLDEQTKFYAPYLSFVVTSRNDNHGGDLLSRMQLFLNSLLQQCRLYKVEAELIIVEWNPPVEAAPLRKALDFSERNRFCPVRIITVPYHLHKKLKHSQHLPLFQMIAKNVGIQRAHGAFVLATNIDVIFSWQLMKYFSSKSFEKNTIYRIDRTDVRSNFPDTKDLTVIERFCEKNILRICSQQGIWTPVRYVPHLSSSSYFYFQSAIHQRLIKPYKKLKPWLPSKRHWHACRRIKNYNKENFIIVTRHLHKAISHFQKYLLMSGRRKQAKELSGGKGFSQKASLRESARNTSLHTNACGDFTLMSKEDWLKLRGNPEWEMFSFHLDSVLMYLADANKIKEVVIQNPARLYHMEHTSGYTPEQAEQMYTRMHGLGIPILSWSQLKKHRQRIYMTGKINPENKPYWGFSDIQLEEQIIV